MSEESKDKLLDRVGIWTSSLCALHCLLLPIFLSVMPFVAGTFFAEAWFERTILSLSMIIGFWALLSGYQRYHRKLYPLASLLLGGLIYWNKNMFGEAYEPFTIAVGAMLIVASHVINLRLCQNTKTCESETELS